MSGQRVGEVSDREGHERCFTASLKEDKILPLSLSLSLSLSLYLSEEQYISWRVSSHSKMLLTVCGLHGGSALSECLTLA